MRSVGKRGFGLDAGLGAEGAALKVNWIVPTQNRDFNRMSASVWLRCLQLIPYFREAGVNCSVNDFDSGADLSVFVRCQNEEALEAAKRFKSKGHRTVLDMVVNYFDEAHVEGLGSPVTQKHIDEARKMLDVVDGVTCSSRYIADRAGEFHNKVAYIPDSIDSRHFTGLKNATEFYAPQLRAVWSGVSSKARELDPILPILRHLNVPLLLISDWRLLRHAYWIRRVLTRRFQFGWWRYRSFPQLILNGEICLSYRDTQSSYNLGHSNFKIAVFMASGIPAVASPVPSYRELLQDGNAGRICRDLDEWESTLETVLRNREMLSEWSKNAVSKAAPYQTENVVREYVGVFRQLLET